MSGWVIVRWVIVRVSNCPRLRQVHAVRLASTFMAVSADSVDSV